MFDFCFALTGVREKHLSMFSSFKLIVEFKATYAWLETAAVHVLRCSLENLDVAYQNFFKKRAGFPKFKSRYDVQSIAFDNVPTQMIGYVTIPKFGSIKGIFHKEIPGEIKRITVSKDAAGRYFASFLCETGAEAPAPIKPTSVVGYDEGLKHFLCTSEGKIVSNPRFAKKMESRLRQAQRHLSRSVKGSKRRHKKKHCVATLHARARNQRKYFTDLTAFNLCNRAKRKNQAVAHQKMAVKNMQQNRNLSKSIADVGWSQFNLKIAQNCLKMGVPLVEVDQFEPTSKRCSCCGEVVERMPLSVRWWTCSACGASHHRDINGAQVTAKLAAFQLGLRGVGTTLPARRRDFNRGSVTVDESSLEHTRPDEARNCRGSGTGREASERVALV